MKLNQLAIPLAVALCAGCASTPPPVAQMAEGRTAVEEAQRTGAADHAPIELREAQTKLAAANEAMRREEHEVARRFAEEAAADARLASTKTQTARAQAAVAEVNKSLETLRSELQRRSN